MRRLFPALSLLALTLAGCGGGMTRAVTTVPRTLDDLAVKTEPFRAGRADADRPARR